MEQKAKNIKITKIHISLLVPHKSARYTKMNFFPITKKACKIQDSGKRYWNNFSYVKCCW